LLAVSLWLDGGAVIAANLGSVSVKTIACLLFIAYASTLLAYGIWTRLVVRYTPGLVAPFALLVPVFGMLSSWLFQGEYFGPLKLGAVSLVMLGLALTVLPARPRAPRN
jgi:O-acetylserine/cysteine efflux transporter